MPKIKGTGIDALRRIAGSRGEEFEKRYMAKLTPAELEAHLNALPVSWVPLNLNEKDNNLMLLADMLHPGDALALQKLGQAMAKETLPRFYQIFIRIPKVSFVFKRAAAMWRSIYDTGDAGIELISEREMIFTLRHFPEYPAFLREYMCGYLTGVAGMLGLRNFRVNKNETDPQAWKWVMAWD